MSQLILYAVRCGKCGAIGRDDGAKGRAALHVILIRQGWWINIQSIRCPACREKGKQ